MTVETLKDQIETTLSTTQKLFDLGELRIYAVLFLLLLSPGGSRPESILLLRYGDIRVTLARDPEGGPHNLMIKFTPEFTKTYLGAKESYVHTNFYWFLLDIYATLVSLSLCLRAFSTGPCFSALKSSS
jgi:hypothetical protein